MLTIESINKQIADKKALLDQVKGTDTEVYTRIVGYYRATRNFNLGQEAQRKQRKGFKIKDEK
jgi:hypothetical protein